MLLEEAGVQTCCLDERSTSGTTRFCYENCVFFGTDAGNDAPQGAWVVAKYKLATGRLVNSSNLPEIHSPGIKNTGSAALGSCLALCMIPGLRDPSRRVT